MIQDRDELKKKSAERFKSLLKEKNMQQKALASLLHVSEQTVSHWSKGTARITEDNAVRIVKLLMENPDRYSVDWLLGKSDYRTELSYREGSEAVTFLRKYHIESMLDVLADLIPRLVNPNSVGAVKSFIPLSDTGLPLYEKFEATTLEDGTVIGPYSSCRVDFSNKSVKQFALTNIFDGEISPDYDFVLSRRELIVLLLEIQSYVINKLNFEQHYHTSRYESEDSYAEEK